MRTAFLVIRALLAAGILVFAIARLGRESEDPLARLQRELARLEATIAATPEDLEDRLAGLRDRLSGLDVGGAAAPRAHGEGGSNRGTIQPTRDDRPRKGRRPARTSPAENSPERIRARMQVDLVRQHVEDLSKDQLGELEEIFLDAQQQERKAHAELRGQPNLVERLRPVLEGIQIERHARLRMLLDDRQYRQLVERVPLPIVPRNAGSSGGPDR